MKEVVKKSNEAGKSKNKISTGHPNFQNHTYLPLYGSKIEISITLLIDKNLLLLITLYFIRFSTKKDDLPDMKIVVLKILKINFFGHTAVNMSTRRDKPVDKHAKTINACVALNLPV